MQKIEDIKEDKILFYDLETDSVYSTYAKLEMIGYQIGIHGEPKLVNLASQKSRDHFKELLRDPEMIKVSFNGINYDDIVLMRHGFYVEPKNRYDMFLALKTIAPMLPAFGLKFVSWFYFGDWHEPERRLKAWLLHNGHKRNQFTSADRELLGTYCLYDVKQTIRLFRMIWEVVQRPQHWDVYRNMELAMAEPLHEMILFAGEWLNLDEINKRIDELGEQKIKLVEKVNKLSNGRIPNAASALQVSNYLAEVDQVELELSKSGHYSVKKEDLVELISTNPIANCVNEIRVISKVMQHYACHRRAVEHEASKPDKFSDALDAGISISKACHVTKFSTDG